MVEKHVAEQPEGWGVDDERAVERRPQEIISDTPVCVRFDAATGEFKEEPVLDPRSVPVRLMLIPRPPAQLAMYVEHRRTGTG